MAQEPFIGYRTPTSSTTWKSTQDSLRLCLFLRNWFFKNYFSNFPMLFAFRKLVNEKHFPVKEKFGLVFRKVFSFYSGRKTLFESCEKFRNIILFADYIKFDSQTFDCYIYIFF